MRYLWPLIAVFVNAPDSLADDGPTIHARLLQSTAWVRASTQGIGTGWIVDAKRRWMITNAHVAGERDRVEAFFVVEKNGQPISERQFYLENQKKLHEDGRAVHGKVLLKSEKTDLALIEFDKLPEGITALPLADRLAGPGEIVHSVGNRHDADALFIHCMGEVRQVGSLTDGYFWRGKKLAVNVPSLITQSPINAGDSGGALVNERGEVVGVLSGIRWQTPIASIAIQVSEVRELLAEAKKAKPSPKTEKSNGTKIYQKMLAATVWVRPTATDGRAAGWIVDRQRRLILTTATGAGSSDLVDIIFPHFESSPSEPDAKRGCLVGELNAYSDRIGLRQSGQLVRGIVLSRDPKRDLALIELESLPDSAGDLTLAKKEPKPAESVHAVSHPSGVEFLWLYSAGIVRKTANIELVGVSMGDSVKPRALLLQIPHQAASSGGPVVNDRGEVVGLLAAKEAAQQQLGYAITATELQTFMESARPMFAPKTADEFLQRGKLLLSRGNVAGATESLERAQKLDRTNLALSRSAADAFIRAGELKPALHLAEQSLNGVESADDQARHALLDAYLGNAEKARVLLAEVFKHDGKCARAFLARGLLSRGKEALADLDEALFLDPRMVEIYRARAALHSTIGNAERALADWSRAIELDPYYPEPIRSRAALYQKRNEPRRAIADYERLIELLPKDAESYRELASAWLMRGDEKKALPAIVAALRWQPAIQKKIFGDIVAHGSALTKRWPDDPDKKASWYEQSLKAIRESVDDETGRRIGEALSGRMKEWNGKVWGDELEKRIRAMGR